MIHHDTQALTMNNVEYVQQQKKHTHYKSYMVIQCVHLAKWYIEKKIVWSNDNFVRYDQIRLCYFDEWQ